MNIESPSIPIVENQKNPPENQEIILSPELQNLVFDVAALTSTLDKNIKKRSPLTSEEAFNPDINELLAKFDVILQRIFKIQFDLDPQADRYHRYGRDFSFRAVNQNFDPHLLASLKVLRRGLGTYATRATDKESQFRGRESQKGGLARLAEFAKTFDQATSHYRDLQGRSFPNLRKDYYRRSQESHPHQQSAQEQWRPVSELWKEGLGQVIAQLQESIAQNSQLTDLEKAQYLFRDLDQVIATNGIRDLAAAKEELATAELETTSLPETNSTDNESASAGHFAKMFERSHENYTRILTMRQHVEQDTPEARRVRELLNARLRARFIGNRPNESTTNLAATSEFATASESATISKFTPTSEFPTASKSPATAESPANFPTIEESVAV